MAKRTHLECAVCGCTQDRACLVAGEPCRWLMVGGKHVCSGCAPFREVVQQAPQWLRLVALRLSSISERRRAGT